MQLVDTQLVLGGIVLACVGVAAVRYNAGEDHAGGRPVPAPLPDLSPEEIGPVMGGPRGELMDDVDLSQGIELSSDAKDVL